MLWTGAAFGASRPRLVQRATNAIQTKLAVARDRRAMQREFDAMVKSEPKLAEVNRQARKEAGVGRKQVVRALYGILGTASMILDVVHPGVGSGFGTVFGFYNLKASNSDLADRVRRANTNTAYHDLSPATAKQLLRFEAAGIINHPLKND